MIYLIGSLRNPELPKLAEYLRSIGHDVFDDWYAPGPNTDDYWRDYCKQRGQSYREALNSPHAWDVFRFDKLHLDKADTVVLVMPAGKSAHMELGYSKGMGKTCYVYFDQEPDRWDIMYRFADDVVFGKAELLNRLNQ